MADEGKLEEVEKIQPDAQGVVKVKPDAAGKYPEVVPWHQYVGIKEKFNRVETELRGQISSLEGRLKAAVSPEEHSKVMAELNTAKADLTRTATELTTIREKSLSEKRGLLTARGIPEDKVKALSEKEIDGALVVLQHSKPGPDLGGGNGSGTPLQGSPLELARQAYSQKK